MRGTVVDNRNVGTVVKCFWPPVGRVGRLVRPLKHATFALNSSRNLQIDGVGGLEFAARLWLFVAVDAVFDNVPVSVLRWIRACTTIVAARAVRPHNLW